MSLYTGVALTWIAVSAAADPETHFAEAVAAEQALDFSGAVTACAQLLREDPQGVRAPSCARRTLRWEARRDPEGTFHGLGTLARVRRDHRIRGAAAGRTDLEALLAHSALSPTLEVEIGIWLAQDALDRLADPERARAEADRALEGSAGVEGALVAQLTSLRSRALAETGAVQGGLAGRDEVATALRQRWRRRLTWLAGATLAGVLATGLPWAVVGWRRERPVPWGLVPIAAAALGAGVIAEMWSAGAGAVAVLGGFLFAVVHLVVVGVHGWYRHVGREPTGWIRLGAVLATLSGLWIAVWATESYRWLGW